MSETRVGIDLGTCFSSVCFDGPSGIQYLKDPDATQLSYSIPSSALVRDDGEIVFGARAEIEKSTRPDCYQREFKRDLGSKTPYQLRDRQVSANELTSLFVKFLAMATEKSTSRTPVGGVITVPVAYDGTRRKLVSAAARRAGLREIELVHEPVAAVVAAAAQGEIPDEGTTLVYDLGGGTFDTALVRMQGGRPEVLGAQGLSDFGGTDIDVLIERDFAEKAGPELAAMFKGVRSEDPQVRARAQRAQIAARDLCRTVKHKLSKSESTAEDLFLMVTYELTRAELETMVRPHLERTIVACRDMLAAAAMTGDDIDHILLVGGASRMPVVGELVGAKLDRPVRCASDPELVVCLGAALLARTPVPTAEPSPELVEARTPAARRRVPAPAANDKSAGLNTPQRRRRPTRTVVSPSVHTDEAADSAGTTASEGPDANSIAATSAGTKAVSSPRTLVQKAPRSTVKRAETPIRIDRAWARAKIPPILKKRAMRDFYTDAIPANKIANARLATKMPKDEKALGLIDCTLFGSAKDAIIFGETAMYEAHVKLPGAPYRPTIRVEYNELTKPLTTKFELSGSSVTVDALQQVLNDIRVAMSQPLDSAESPSDALLAISYSADGRRLLTAGHGTVRAWPANLSGPDARLRVDLSKAVNSVATSSGTRLAIGSDDGTAQIWDAGSGKQLRVHKAGRSVWEVRFSPDDRHLALGCAGGIARVIDSQKGSSLCELAHGNDVTSVAFDHTGTLLATGSKDGKARVWQWEKSAQIKTITYQEKVYSVDFSPTNNVLAVGTAGGVAEIWDVATLKSVAVLAHGAPVRCVRFSRDASMLATATSSDVDVWDVRSQQKLFTKPDFIEAWGIAWHPDGTALATASAAGAQVWSL